MCRIRLLVAAALLLISNGAIAQISSPQAIEAIALGTHEIHVYWIEVQGAAGYRILRDGATIGSAATGEKEYVDRAAEPGHNYHYQVASFNSVGDSVLSRAYLEQAFAELPAETRCDVLVVGATTAGVAAAVTAARHGLNVVLIEETRRLGGMPVNGLGATDLRRTEHSSGFFEEFRQRVRALYGSGDGLAYEPRIAHQAIKEIVWSTPGLVVHRQVRPVKVHKRGADIDMVECEEVPSGRRVRFLPKQVVDATDTGDVAAWAGAPFRLGREARSKREPHAGHLYYDRAGDKPLPGSTGRGDGRVQAYAYLMTVKDYGPHADRTIPKPPGYDPRKYEHAPNFSVSWAVTSGKLPGGKFEVNQHPQGSDLQVVNYPYATASYAQRRKIEQLFKEHALGYLYYIQTVEGHKNIGLSEDDYRDNDNWPQLLYIREARRFEADEVLDEADISGSRKVARPDVIGLGDYPMDSHAVEPKTNWSTPDMGEGEFYLPQYTPWHQVPYRIMLPKGIDNCFVPTAVSATHVAYGTVRLEPVRMHFGQAAGIACALCLRDGLTPRSIPVRQIQAELLEWDRGRGGQGEKGQGERSPTLPLSHSPTLLYFFPDIKPGVRRYEAIEWLGARGFWPSPEPAQRTAASGMQAAPFDPEAPISGEEAARVLGMLAARVAAQAGSAFDFGDSVRYAREKPRGTLAPLTRGAGALMLAQFMGWSAPARAAHYADLTAGSPVAIAAEALYANAIDSVLWDDWSAYVPETAHRFEPLYFRPDQPLTRAQWAQMVYLAHIHFGPLWFDHPADEATAIPVQPGSR